MVPWVCCYSLCITPLLHVSITCHSFCWSGKGPDIVLESAHGMRFGSVDMTTTGTTGGKKTSYIEGIFQIDLINTLITLRNYTG